MTAQRYDTVLVHEPGIEPWRGIVMTIKPPVAENKKGQQVDQWADVRREADGIEWKVPLSFLEVLEARAFGIAKPSRIIAGIEQLPVDQDEYERAIEAEEYDEDEGRLGEPARGPF